MRTLLILSALLLTASPAAAQWSDFPLKNVPLLPDGRPNLTAPAPRTRDGKPDLSGVWWVPFAGPEADVPGAVPKYLLNLAADLKPGVVMMLPWAEAFVKEQIAALGKNHPVSRCLPPGVPLSYTTPVPFKILQTPDLVVMLYEYSNSFRQVFVDGRALPTDPLPTWVGYSVGRWEGDVFVVETTGFNEKTWLDGVGHPHTEALRVTERYTRQDVGHMNIQITIDDPKAYTKPWTNTIGTELLTKTDVMEYVCAENAPSTNPSALQRP
jgi:hypothetical protein